MLDEAITKGDAAMSQTMSVTGSSQSDATKINSQRRSNSHGALSRWLHRASRTGRMIAVPPLNWPVDLFADDVTMDELVADYFPLPPHVPATSLGNRNQESVARTSH
jgi:hypothetical protein